MQSQGTDAPSSRGLHALPMKTPAKDTAGPPCPVGVPRLGGRLEDIAAPLTLTSNDSDTESAGPISTPASVSDFLQKKVKLLRLVNR